MQQAPEVEALRLELPLVLRDSVGSLHHRGSLGTRAGQLRSVRVFFPENAPQATKKGRMKYTSGCYYRVQYMEMRR